MEIPAISRKENQVQEHPAAKIAAGLDYILDLLQGQAIWPRTISTRTLGGKQLMVNSREEALARFAQANYLDCRISAYPPNATENPSELEQFQGLKYTTPRNLVVIIDLDKLNFSTEKALNLALTKTLQNIKSILEVDPIVIWSGNGYHIYLVMDSDGINLESIKDFTGMAGGDISLKFLRFTEWFLSSGKSDKAHNTTVSFNNCMLRVPGSFNSKNNCQVRIINYQENTPATPAIPASVSIKPLLRDFRRYLIDEKLKEARQKQHKQQPLPSSTNSSIYWIEHLLETPIADYRKYCIWRILTPYLLNIRKLPEQQCYDTIKEWLDKCNELRRLDFNTKQRISDGLEGSKEGYLPISFEKLKVENPGLISLLGLG